MFKKKQTTPKSLPTTPTEYPPGTFIQTEKGYFYMVSRMKRYHIISKRVLDSWNPQRIVETTEAAVRHCRVAAKMKFRNGSLIHNFYDGKMYLIVDGMRCRITGPDALERIGAVGEQPIVISNQEANLHEPGEDLN